MKFLIYKILKKINLFYFKFKTYLSYDFKISKKNIKLEQELIFQNEGLDRKKGEDKILSIIRDNPDLNNNLKSEHQILFSSISEKKKCPKILEIGTYDGKNALLLNILFPESEIFTIDLDENDSNFSNTYQRSKVNEKIKFCKERDDRLKNNKNIIFKKLNSINIKNLNQTFDLIWIDGAHGYPMVTIDIINSLNIIKEDGIILCDDVYKNTTINDKFYKSTAAFETLETLRNNNMIYSNLFYKRVEKSFNKYALERKFIALVKKL